MRGKLIELFGEMRKAPESKPRFARIGTPSKQLLHEVPKSPTNAELSQDERIDETLLWYDFEIIDSAPYKLFSGGPTFRSLIPWGSNEQTQSSHSRQAVCNQIQTSRDATWFSYAVLMERRGSISDSSGWVIFLEVGGDYAGQGGFEYKQTEDVLKSLMDWVDVSEFEVDLQALWKFYYSKIGKAVKDPLSGVADESIRFRLDELPRLYPPIHGRMMRQRSRTVNTSAAESDQNKEEQVPASRIVAAIVSCNMLSNKVLGCQFFNASPEVVDTLYTPCRNENEFKIKIGALSLLFDIELKLLRGKVRDARDDWKSIKLLREWAEQNSLRCDAYMFEIWKNIVDLRNTSFPFHRTNERILLVLSFFGQAYPPNYEQLWKVILNRLLTSLLMLIELSRKI